MLKLMFRGTLAAMFCLTGLTVTADETKDEKKKKETKVETRVLKMSKRVTVGPDGKIQIEEIGGDTSKLPKKALEALKKAGIDVLDISKPGALSVRVLGDVDDEGIGAIKLGGEMSGKIVIVGEDGKQDVHEFGTKLPLDGDAIAKRIRVAMQQQLKGQEEAKDAVESAMKQVEAALSGLDAKIAVQVRSALGDGEEEEREEVIIIKQEDDDDEDEEEVDEVETKILGTLERILKRLDKLEADVQALKNDEII